MLQSNTVASRRPVKPVPFRQIKGVRVYQGAQRRTMVGNMAETTCCLRPRGRRREGPRRSNRRGVKVG